MVAFHVVRDIVLFYYVLPVVLDHDVAHLEIAVDDSL